MEFCKDPDSRLHRIARNVHDHGHAYQADDGSDEIESVLPRPVRAPSPQQREDDEHPAIGRVHPSEVSSLEGRNNAVEDQ